MNMNAQMIFWVAALIVFLIAEGITVSLVSLWFVGGALAAFLVSFATQNFWIQIAVFLGVSIVLLLLLRPLAVRFSVKEKDRITTGANGLVGKRALVTEEIVIGKHLIGIPVIGQPDTKGGSQHQDGKQDPVQEGREGLEANPASEDTGERNQRNDDLQDRQHFADTGVVNTEYGVAHRILRCHEPVTGIENHGGEH